MGRRARLEFRARQHGPARARERGTLDKKKEKRESLFFLPERFFKTAPIGADFCASDCDRGGPARRGAGERPPLRFPFARGNEPEEVQRRFSGSSCLSAFSIASINRFQKKNHLPGSGERSLKLTYDSIRSQRMYPNVSDVAT